MNQPNINIHSHISNRIISFCLNRLNIISTSSISISSRCNINCSNIICCSNINEMLSLRKRADITAPSLGKYYNGTVVKLLEAPKNGWVKVQIAGQAEGYVQTSYLAMEGQSVTVGHRQMVIDNKSGTGLNMRSKPETNGKKIALYDNGVEVTVIGQWYNGWYHIVVDGQYGFVLDRLSEIK